MNNTELKKAEETYNSNYNKYKLFCDEMQELIKKLINSNKIYCHSVTGRVKDKESFLKKCGKEDGNSEKYNCIEQITDIIGIRVITYILEDVQKVCKLVENEFVKDNDNSVDKSSVLKPNEFGYLSVHYILSLKPNRSKLPEYISYENMRFEIQVRTLLQHTWAEISHDRDYKFGGELPTDIKRRFSMSAGVLELIDREFQGISDELIRYEEEVKEKVESGNLNIEINSTSLFEYLNDKFKIDKLERTFNGYDNIIIDELKKFGIKTIGELDKIIPEDFEESSGTIYNYNNFVGLVRDIMIISDSRKYFTDCWDAKWKGIDNDTYNLFALYNVDIDEIIATYNLYYNNEFN